MKLSNEWAVTTIDGSVAWLHQPSGERFHCNIFKLVELANKARVDLTESMTPHGMVRLVSEYEKPENE